MPSGPEALVVRVGLKYKEKPAIALWGSDQVGLMYAALDLAQRVSWTQAGDPPFRIRSKYERKTISSGSWRRDFHNEPGVL